MLIFPHSLFFCLFTCAMDQHVLEPEPRHGQVIALLCEVALFDSNHGSHVVKTALKGKLMRFKGSIPAGSTVVLIHEGMIHMEKDQCTIFATESTRVFPRPYINVHDLPSSSAFVYSLSHARVNFRARAFMSTWAAAIHN